MIYRDGTKTPQEVPSILISFWENKTMSETGQLPDLHSQRSSSGGNTLSKCGRDSSEVCTLGLLEAGLLQSPRPQGPQPPTQKPPTPHQEARSRLGFCLFPETLPQLIGGAKWKKMGQQEGHTSLLRAAQVCCWDHRTCMRFRLTLSGNTPGKWRCPSSQSAVLPAPRALAAFLGLL